MIIIDFIPGPIYRFGHWLVERPKYIKWWVQRANRKVPPCDCWEFNSSLASYLVQGLDYLLDEGNTDWGSPIHKREYKELDFARRTLREFISWHDQHSVVHDKELARKYNKYDKNWTIYVPKKDFERHERDLQKAFGYIGKWLWGLWD